MIFCAKIELIQIKGAFCKQSSNAHMLCFIRCVIKCDLIRHDCSAVLQYFPVFDTVEKVEHGRVKEIYLVAKKTPRLFCDFILFFLAQFLLPFYPFF